MIETLFVIDRHITYDGKQLRSRWAQTEFGLEGDCLVAFIGPADVATEDLVDMDDRRSGAFIRAASMLHFIGEFFGTDLEKGVLLQRLLMCVIKESIEAASATGGTDVAIRRDGDDLYLESPKKGKMTVSIATDSPVSVLLHAAVNIDSEGAPVEASGLKDISVDAGSLGNTVLKKFENELYEIERARHKVRAVD